MSLNFIKMHGLGNDFVIFDARKTPLSLSPDRMRQIADRQRGVGCDQLIVMEPAKDANADVFMRIRNPDASEVEACGNATRCVASLTMKETGKSVCIIQTVAGLLYCTSMENGLVAVDMGPPRLEWAQIPLSKQCDTLHLPLSGDPVAVNVGNPHCVYVCEDVEAVSMDKEGPKAEHNPLFPERTNVEYIGMLGTDHIRMRVWERGAGITQACGSGACAAAVAAIRRGLTGRKVRVTLDGGDLMIEWRENDGHIIMTGPVSHVFGGILP